MSQKLMSEERIASLFERAADGHRPVDVSTGTGRARWLRTIDFTRPTKFTPDQENRLRRAHELFCRLAATKLAAEHRMALQLNIVDVQQLTWADAHAMVGRDALSATIEADPIGTKLLMIVERPLLLVCVERLLGSPIEDAPAERTLTDIDLILVKRVLSALTGSLSTTWEQMAGITMRQLSVDPHLETAQVVATSEPTLALVIEATLEDTTSRVVLLLPHASVQPVAASYSKRPERGGDGDVEAADAVRTGLGDIQITLRAEVGETRLPIRDVLALVPGDIVPLGIPAGAPIALQADDVRLHDVRPGRHGRARAVQILAPGGTG